MSKLPPYTIRVSQRARSIRISISVDQGLVVTIPRGYDPRNVPGVIQQKLDWVENSLEKLKKSAEVLSKNPVLPDVIELPVIREQWRVRYQPGSDTRLSLKVEPFSTLLISGPIKNKTLVRKLLSRWLHNKAEVYFQVRLSELSNHMGMNYSRLVVRNQRTRWGSCSTNGTISLNQRLLLLPEHLASYVLVHELCHTVVHSHSREFWDLVAHYIPDHKLRRAELRKITASLPNW